jgi:hypothetical protein
LGKIQNCSKKSQEKIKSDPARDRAESDYGRESIQWMRLRDSSEDFKAATAPKSSFPFSDFCRNTASAS